MKARLEEIEKEAESLREMREVREAQEREAKAIAAVSSPAGEEMETEDDKQAADERSIYVGNVSFYSCEICEFMDLYAVRLG